MLHIFPDWFYTIIQSQQCWFVKHVPHPPLGVPLAYSRQTKRTFETTTSIKLFHIKVECEHVALYTAFMQSGEKQVQAVFTLAGIIFKDSYFLVFISFDYPGVCQSKDRLFVFSCTCSLKSVFFICIDLTRIHVYQ